MVEDTQTVSSATELEARQVQQANESGRTPVVFVHGLWLLPSSWDRWAELFEHAGYVPVSISRSSFKHQEDNEGVTEFVELPDRGHALVIDDNWQEVAETALKSVGRFVS
jgi:hypothetical protein